MENRRDSRTAKERAAAEKQERAFHHKRQLAGLPPLNYEASFTFNVRDITDADAEALHARIEGEVARLVDEFEKPEDPLERSPGFASSSYSTEKNIEAA